MKVKTPYSGFEAEFCVYADDHECDEFMLARRPTNNNDPQPVKECYVTVSDRQVISIAGHLTGRLSRARFDLIADGTFVGTRQVEADKDGQPKQHNRRRIEFRSINTVVPPLAGEGSNGKVVDGELFTQRLNVNTDGRYLGGNGKAWGVGSLVVIISVEETFSSEGYWPDRTDYPDRLLGNWEHRQDEVQDSGIEPTHCLGLVNVNRSVIPQKCNKFFNQFEGTRFGTRPVAKLVFYYRNKSAIFSAGGMPCPNKAYPVEEEFQEQSPIRSDTAHSPSIIEAEDNEGSLFLQSPSTTQPKRKLGGTLVIPKDEPNCAKAFYELVMDNELERLQRSSKILGRERQALVRDADSASAAIVASRTVTIGGNEYRLLSIRAIDDLMQKEGTALTQLLHHVFPGLPREHRHEAAEILVRYLHGFAEVCENAQGRLICIRAADLAEYNAQQRRRPDKRPRAHSPEERQAGKRSRVAVERPDMQPPVLTDPRAELRRKAKERIELLQLEQTRLAEEAAREAAALAELEHDELHAVHESVEDVDQLGDGLSSQAAEHHAQVVDEDAEGESEGSIYMPDL